MRCVLFGLAIVLAVAGCGGSGGGPFVGTPRPTASSSPSSAPPPLAATQLTLVVSHACCASYVSPGIASVTITLTSVNGAAPPGGVTASITANVTASSCTSGCTVAGPSVPPGSDGFTIATFSGSNGGGQLLSQGSATTTVVANTTNALNATLLGVPAAFALSGVPAGAAGTAIASTPLMLAVKDAAGFTIFGTYLHPVTISDSDGSSLSQGSSVSLNGGPAARSVVSTASSDALAFAYGGLAIAPVTLTASAGGAASATATFAPALNPIVTSTSEIDLYATSGTGSSGTLTASEIGWTNSPYGRALSLSAPAACSSIATISPASGTTFTATAIASPSSGTCTAQLADGVSQTHDITLTYTKSSIGVYTRGAL